MAKKQNDSRFKVVVTSLIVLTILLISFMEFGPAGLLLNQAVRFLFGDYHFVVYLLLVLACLYLIRHQDFKAISKRKTVGMVLLFLSYLLLSVLLTKFQYQGFESMRWFFDRSSQIFFKKEQAYGGLFGVALYALLSQLFAKAGTIVITIVLSFLGFVMTFNVRKIYRFIKNVLRVTRDFLLKICKSLRKGLKGAKDLFVVEDDEDFIEDLEQDVRPSLRNDFIDIAAESSSTDEKVDDKSLQDAVLDESTVSMPESLSDYRLPPLDLLDEAKVGSASSVNKTAASNKGKHLIKVLEQFNIPASLVETHIGPSVTKFEIRPDSSVKVSRISSIEDNIKMELAATDIRIEAPVPGKNTVGIEIPNVETSAVKMHELLSKIPKKYDQIPLLLTLGKDLTGQTVYTDLSKLPHLLVAGATGSGKSVCINSIITTILMRTSPDQVKLVLIDPKKVEFTHFANIPHLESPVVTDPLEAAVALNRVVQKMDNRYEVFSSIGVRNITGYYDYKKEHPDEELPEMPLLVVIIDELADLMLAAGKEVEMSIQRITQLARAAGIHLIVATQRPSTDVITGVIKANIPSRISFAVSSSIDSRTILDAGGAENLLGNGDMLYLPVGESAPIRLQGVFVSDGEINRITEFTNQQLDPEFDDAFEDLREKKVDETGTPVLPKDEMYEDVRLWVVREQKASTSLLQRTFGIGYNRAARMIDDLEDEGIIGPQNGSRPRDVYITEEELVNLQNNEDLISE